MELVSIAAIAENRVIGRNERIPWDLPEDRRQYRARVADRAVVLGRTTFEAMRDILPGAMQIVLSRSDREYDVSTAFPASSVEQTVDIAARHGAETAYVIGGEDIYRLFQPHLDRMVLTRVPGEYEGDAYYPEWDEDAWSRTATTEYDRFTVEEWVRTAPDGEDEDG